MVLLQYGNWLESDQDRGFIDSWAQQNYSIVSADGIPCGYVCVEYATDHIHLAEIVIDPAYQGKGLGTRLLKGIIDSANEMHKPVRLHTQLKNRAIGLYLRLGFVEYGRTERHILLEHYPSG